MIHGLIAAACGGLLLSLAFPPVRFDLVAWVAFIPLLWAISREDRPAWAAVHGGAFGLSFFLVDVNWVYGTLTVYGHFAAITAVLVFAGMVLVLSMFPAGFALIVAILRDRGLSSHIVAPFAWIVVEYVRAMILTGFPWNLVGYSQMDNLILVQIADFTGVYGISFVILLVNAALWELLRSLFGKEPIPWRVIAVAGALLVCTIGYGHVMLNRFPTTERSSQEYRIGILQGNIAQDVKWASAARPYTFAIYKTLGRIAEKQGARLVVWPETSVPVLFGGADPDWKKAGEISEKIGLPMLIGAPSTEGDADRPRYYNSAFLVEGTHIRSRYDKIHLVPFGEYMPLTWLLPLGPGIAAREADYSPGDTMTVMHVDGCPPFSVLICYEAIFPELAREAVRNGARMLVNITNDGWFARSAAPYQHLAMARMRSIENRVWLLRAANTGISAAVDPTGRVVTHLPLDKDGVIVVGVPSPAEGGSFYSRYGDIFALGCIALVAAMALRLRRHPVRRT